MYHNFITCTTASIGTIDNILIRNFEKDGMLSDYEAYVDEADAKAILTGTRMAEVSFIGSCSYMQKSFASHVFVCPTNVNLRHLAGLAIDAFQKNPAQNICKRCTTWLC